MYRGHCLLLNSILVSLTSILCAHAEMVQEMRKVAGGTEANTDELTVEDRNLLSVAEKNIIGARRDR